MNDPERKEEKSYLEKRLEELEKRLSPGKGLGPMHSWITILSRFLENSVDIFLIFSAQGRVLYANPACEKALGFPPGSLENRDISSLVEPTQLGEFTDKLARHGHPLASFRGEITLRDRKGEPRTIEYSILNLCHEPLVEGFVLNGRDITEKALMEEALRRSERYYRSLIAQAGDMISVLDGDLRYRWGSLAGRRITGYTPADIYGRSFFDFIPEEARETAERKLREVLEKPGTPVHLEGPFIHKDGTVHQHEAIITNLLDDPDVQGIIINSRDITERKKMEEELRKRNRELDLFAQTVAHDLKTPLSVVDGYIQLLLKERCEPGEASQYLRNCYHAVKRMEELIDSLLEYARMGAPETGVEPVSPAGIAEEVIREREILLAERKANILVSPRWRRCPKVSVSPFKFRQVLANLLDNAVKYSLPGRKPVVELDTEWEGGEATFHIRDNGRGIPPEDLDKVFLPFWRRGTHTEAGLGIGLSTVKHAVESWGGRIWVDSTPGSGSTFHFTAPLAKWVKSTPSP